ncbi:hypothetical protein GEMRC1_009070 [Eukaryota sp. GEM-RC1]
MGNCTLIGTSFLDILPLSLSVEAKNFLIFPPEVSYNSRIEFTLVEDIKHLFITVGSQAVPVNNGANILNLQDASTFISLHRFSQSMNISVVTSMFYSEIPEVIELNNSQSSLIDLRNILYRLNVRCLGFCDLHSKYIHESVPIISFTGFESETITLEFIILYLNSNFNFRIPIVVENPPVFELISPNVVTTSEDSLLEILSYSHFVITGYFLIDDSVIEPTNVELISSSDSFFVYRFDLNLTSMSVFDGEYVLDLCWSQIGFRRQLVSEIKFFNLEFSSNDHVSVFEHRDISVDFKGNLTSNVTCSIDDQTFFGQVVDHVLVCKSVQIPTFQQHVSVNVYYDYFLLNSFELHGEAFLEEICFSSFTHHPVVNSFEINSNMKTNLIFDGSRCCSVDVSYCSEFFYINEMVSFFL